MPDDLSGVPDFVKALWECIQEADAGSTDTAASEQASAQSFEGLLDGSSDEHLFTAKWDG